MTEREMKAMSKAQLMEAMTALTREKEELNGAMCFLLDPEKASFITGVVLPVDGGFNAFSGV